MFFLILGSLFVNRTGVEEDEAMFAAPLYREWCFFALPWRHGRMPIMHMSYVGALKTWLYTPIAAFWTPGAAMLRVPALAIGALTIVLFWLLLESLNGRVAAWTGCLLLASDTAFVLTTVFDWGPVAIQHLLLTAILLLCVLWWRGRADGWLFLAAVCAGLAFWDKAVFVWMFAGLIAGSMGFWRGIWQRLSWRRFALVVVGLCLGAAPLIYYNFSSDPKFLTFRANTRLTPGQFGPKFRVLRMTWNGSALFGYMVYQDADRPKPARSAVERASFALHGIFGDRRRGYLEFALAVSIVLLPFLWRSRARMPALFTLIAGGIGWTVMALLDGGGSVHHAVLLWPLPELFAAICLAEGSAQFRFGRAALTVAVAFLVAANLLLANQYLFQFVRNGGSGSWTDAIYALAEEVRQSKQVLLVDWGAQDPLSFLNQDHPSVRTVADPFLPPGEPEASRKADLELLSNPDAVWVEHTASSEVSRGINERLRQAAAAAGFDQAVLSTVCDQNGRPIFETFHFVRKPQ
ncbi:MAG TPA: hypothetical protein VKX49_24335 [Bryobacteraceae bacterium]|nr:hypothetical protein [Bryobacteraceae bacterium]